MKFFNGIAAIKTFLSRIINFGPKFVMSYYLDADHYDTNVNKMA